MFIKLMGSVWDGENRKEELGFNLSCDLKPKCGSLYDWEVVLDLLDEILV